MLPHYFDRNYKKLISVKSVNVDLLHAMIKRVEKLQKYISVFLKKK